MSKKRREVLGPYIYGPFPALLSTSVIKRYLLPSNWHEGLHLSDYWGKFFFLGKKFYSHGWKKYYITTFFPATPFLYIQYTLVDTIVVFNSLFDTGTIILWFYSFQLYSIPLGTNPSTSKVFSDRKLECM